jgi:hypothetical protein
MPRTPLDYSNTYFYKIVCKDLNIKDTYVGHTTNFTVRRNGHKTNCLNPNAINHNTYVYRFIRDNGGWDNFDMVLIDREACADRLDSEKKERMYIEELNATLNQFIPSRTRKEWDEENKEKIQEYKRNWHMNNRDRLLERKREIYLEKQEEIKTKTKQYYIEHKEKVDEWRNTKFSCDCGGSYFNHNKARHMKTVKHREYLKSFED